jgi:hypothetical protein
MLIHTGEKQSGRTERTIARAVKEIIRNKVDRLTFCCGADNTLQLMQRLQKALQKETRRTVEREGDALFIRRVFGDPQIVTFVDERRKLSSQRGVQQVADHSFIEQEQRIIAKQLEWLEKLLIR